MRASNVVFARQRGFSLIELMVGLVIGLLTILVITQVMTLAEGKRRAVSMGSDAQVNGALAMFAMQRDIAQAGYGASADPDALGCTVDYQFGSDTSKKASFTLAPVVIKAPTAASAPVQISILQASTTNFSAPLLLTGAALQADNHFTVASTLGATAGNVMIAVPATLTSSDCALFSVTSDTASAATTLSNTNLPHVLGTGASQWNQSNAVPAGGFASSSYLLNMGAMVYRTYGVSSTTGNLQVTELSPTDGTSTTQDLYPQIVNLMALYGKDKNNDGVVDAYESTPPGSNAEWKQVLAIRIALVARSNQYEKDIVTSAAPLWDVGAKPVISGTSTCHGSSSCLSLDVSGVTDWQHYRYKVYDTIVPLRNMLWNN